MVKDKEMMESLINALKLCGELKLAELKGEVEFKGDLRKYKYKLEVINSYK